MAKVKRFILALIGACAVTAVAHAATEAGTEIRNQASATYTDPDGRSQSSTSNEVITTVSELPGLEILPNKSGGTEAPHNFTNTPALTQEAAPGNTVYFAYTLRNTGNATDTYQVEHTTGGGGITASIYQDINGDGKVDPGDRFLHNGTSFGGTATLPVAPGDTIALVVAYQVPTNATGGTSYQVDIDARSVNDGATTDAVSNWNQTDVKIQGNLTITKSVSQQVAKTGDALVYEIGGSNTGNLDVYGATFPVGLIDIGTAQRTGVLVSDDLPSQLFTSGSTVSFSDLGKGPAHATVVYWTGTQWVANAASISTTDPKIGLFIPDTNGTNTTQESALTPGQDFKLAFKVTVKNNDAGNLIANTATVAFDDDATDSGSDNDPDKEVTSNQALTTLGGDGAQLPQVYIGTQANAKATGTDTNDDAQNETPAYGAEGTLDGVRAEAGETLVFRHKVLNEGNVEDTFEIEAEMVADFGATLLLFKSDGNTPLGDTNRDGSPDTGPLPASTGATEIVVKVVIPADHAGDAGNHKVKVTATSSLTQGTAAQRINTTYDIIGQIYPVGVDIATDGESSDGVAGDDNPGAASSLPGTYVDFPLDVANIRTDGTATGAVDTYNLTYTSTKDLSVVFYADLDGDGTLDDDELVPISNTNSLNPSALQSIIVRAIIPDNATEGATGLQVTATSTNRSSVTDSVSIPLSVTKNPLINLEPDNSAVSVRGGTVTYRHLLTNPGNTTEDFTITGAHSGTGYQYVLVDNAGATLGTGQSHTVNLAPTNQFEFYVKVFVPDNAPIGSSDRLVLTATGQTNGQTDSAVDITTVIQGNLQLSKSVDKTSAKPTRANESDAGKYDPVTYTVTYKNLGSAEITNVVIVDPVPAHARIVVDSTKKGGAGLANPTGPSIQYSTDGGTNWGAAPAADNDGSAPSVTHIRWTVGNLAAGNQGQVTFQILID